MVTFCVLWRGCPPNHHGALTTHNTSYRLLRIRLSKYKTSLQSIALCILQVSLLAIRPLFRFTVTSICAMRIPSTLVLPKGTRIRLFASITCILLCCILPQCLQSFSFEKISRNAAYKRQFAPQAGGRQSVEEEYVNPVTKVLGNFVSKEKSVDIFNNINWTKKKRSRTSLSSLAADIEKALIEKEWFVTGNVDASFFSDSFAFQDPDVKIKGIESYARGVNKIFSQKDSRAEIIAARVNETVSDSITVTWRLTGSVNIGPGLKIKPYVVYTDFKVDPSDGLIVFQEDRFSIPGYDILLSAFFPFLVAAGVRFLAPPAPPVDVLRGEFLRKEQELKKLKSKPGSKNKGKSLFW